MFQNYQFLNMDTGRKVEQDFLLYHLKETIPENSLIITVHEKKYEDSEFPQEERCYRFQMHGNEFYTYAIPRNKKIYLMDIYREYDPEIVSKYKNVFYYKSLYSYHEKDIDWVADCHDYETAYWVAREFEENHQLAPVVTKIVSNYGFHIRWMHQIEEKWDFTIDGKGDLEIGFYKIEDYY